MTTRESGSAQGARAGTVCNQAWTRSAIADSPTAPLRMPMLVMPDLDGRQESGRGGRQLQRVPRAGMAGIGELLQPGPTGADKRDLRHREHAVDEDQHEEEGEVGHARPDPPCELQVSPHHYRRGGCAR